MYKNLVLMFTVLLLVIVPIALLSPSLFSNVPVSYLPKYATYGIVSSVIVGLIFLASSVSLSNETKKRVELMEPERGGDGIALFVSYII